MGRAFRRLEVPSHDAWEPSVLQDAAQEKQAKEMYASLKRYLKEKVRERLMSGEERGIDASRRWRQSGGDGEVGETAAKRGIDLGEKWWPGGNRF